jgi:hypothetical protein
MQEGSVMTVAALSFAAGVLASLLYGMVAEEIRRHVRNRRPIRRPAPRQTVAEITTHPQFERKAR